MGKGNPNHRHALIALGLSLAAIVSLAYIEAANQPSDNQETYARPHHIQSHGNSDVSADVSAIVDALREFDPWVDTVAQWIMAIFAMAATGVSFWAVWLLKETLVSTRAAVEITTESNEIMVAQMRPWIVIERDAACDFYLSDKISGVSWRFKIKNYAQSPAMSTVISDELVFFESSHEFMAAFKRFVSRCRDQSDSFQGTAIFRDSSGDGISWSRRSVAVRRETMYHGLFACVTYRYRDKIGIDAQAFVINETQIGRFGPMTHKLIAHERLRVIE